MIREDTYLADMNPLYKLFLVAQPDGRFRLNFRAVLYLFLAVCVVNAVIYFFITGPSFARHP